MGRKRFQESLFWNVLLKIERVLLIVCSLTTVLLICLSVFMRYILHKNFYGSEESIIIFAFWLYFLGASYGSFDKSHIKADIASVYIKNARIRDAVALVASMVTVFVNLVITKWAWDYVVWGIQKMPRTTGLKIPLVIPQSAILIGLILMCFYHVYYLVVDFRAYLKNEPLKREQEGDEN